MNPEWLPLLCWQTQLEVLDNRLPVARFAIDASLPGRTGLEPLPRLEAIQIRLIAAFACDRVHAVEQFEDVLTELTFLAGGGADVHAGQAVPSREPFILHGDPVPPRVAVAQVWAMLDE